MNPIVHLAQNVFPTAMLLDLTGMESLIEKEDTGDAEKVRTA